MKNIEYSIEDLEIELSDLCKQVESKVKNFASEEEIKELEKSVLLDKNSCFRTISSKMRKVSCSHKKEFGIMLNSTKNKCLDIIDQKKCAIKILADSQRFMKERVDVSIIKDANNIGAKSLVQDVIDSLAIAFENNGFAVLDSFEIEDDYHNFLALNFPKDHPARDMQDTFYVNVLDEDKEYKLLRTHTSNMQIRTLSKMNPVDFYQGNKIAGFAAGKCFRNEDVSYRSHMFFNQIEVFVAGRDVTIEDLMGCVDFIIYNLFGPHCKKRVRSSYFPFVEPGIEVDISCLLCGGPGCSVCKHTGWLEILGAGMIHNQVLNNTLGNGHGCTGYALGLGLERIVMLKKDIQDIRNIHEGGISILN